MVPTFGDHVLITLTLDEYRPKDEVKIFVRDWRNYSSVVITNAIKDSLNAISYDLNMLNVQEHTIVKLRGPNKQLKREKTET